jgi:hypothetical protein
MSLLVGLILTALNGPVGTESRGVAGFANLDTVPLNLFKITFTSSRLNDTIFYFLKLEAERLKGMSRA